MNTDLAGSRYWEQVWSRRTGSRAEVLSFGYYRFGRLLERYVRRGTRVCEVGCGGSVWLPRLAGSGAVLLGIDYSPVGLESLEARLQAAGAAAEVRCADFFDPNAFPPEWADVVFSLGFIEHFSEPDRVAGRFAEMVTKGGYVITLVPNLAGWWGPLQRRLDADVYRLHLVFEPDTLDRVHRNAGLTVVQPAEYFGGVGLCSLNYSRMLGSWPRTVKWLMRLTWVIQQSISWAAFWCLPRRGESRKWSAYIVGVYRRPGEA